MNKDQELKMQLLEKFCEPNDIAGVNFCREAYKFLNEDQDAARIVEKRGECQNRHLHGAFIETIDGRLFTADEWRDQDIENSSVNSVVVINGENAVRVSLIEGGNMKMHSSYDGELEKYMTSIKEIDDAENDFNGLFNTQNILKFNDGDEFAAGFCNNILLPDGETKCHLPSLGEMRLIRFYRKQVQECLSACGGDLFKDEWYWTSTFWGVGDDAYRRCWGLHWSYGGVNDYTLYGSRRVRPVAAY